MVLPFLLFFTFSVLIYLFMPNKCSLAHNLSSGTLPGLGGVIQKVRKEKAINSIKNQLPIQLYFGDFKRVGLDHSAVAASFLRVRDARLRSFSAFRKLAAATSFMRSCSAVRGQIETAVMERSRQSSTTFASLRKTAQ